MNVWITLVVIDVRNVVLRTTSIRGRKARARLGYPTTRPLVKVSVICTQNELFFNPLNVEHFFERLPN